MAKKTTNTATTAPTPMMAQYLAIKKTAPGSLLFYRMGDFYELFFDDARAASASLGIALTKRGKHLGEDIPMCGVPVAAAQTYLPRLIAKGHKVAICEQTEAPAEAKKRGAKAVVRREIVRIITPGTLTEDNLLEPRQASRICALHRDGTGAWGMAWADVSTGEFCAAQPGETGVGELLSALTPKEVLVSETEQVEFAPIIDLALPGMIATPLPAGNFRAAQHLDALCAAHGVRSLDGFGDFSNAEKAALCALHGYLQITQAGQPSRLAPPCHLDHHQWMAIDPATRSSLEILTTLTGKKKGALLANLDRTLSPGGGRLFADRLTRPALERKTIEQRYDAVAYFMQEPNILADVREALRACPDGERALSRLILQRGGPRDLATIARILHSGEALNAIFPIAALSPPPKELSDALQCLSLARDSEAGVLCRDLQKALNDELPLYTRDGGFIAKGWSAALDETRELGRNARQVIARLQADYAQKSGVSSLKIKHNNVLGYFIEVTPRHADKLMIEPLNEDFTHRQTLASAVRFSTLELAELDAKITGAAERAMALETELFLAFTARISAMAETIRLRSTALAVLDVATGAARWAIENKAVRPELSDDPVFVIEGGRHPVVETALSVNGDTPFTANDCALDGRADQHPRLCFVTGPNMAGKSTFLRQNALFAIMAQAGFYVPARRAQIGLVDRVFSRVGAADDLGRGRSTFMAEMIETAAILNQAGPRALVILDEIGRGTSTFDGLAIAWAVAEHLYKINQCRALFATHYHELTSLTATLSGAGNLSLRAREWEGDLIFLHEVVKGAADRSYGVHVARLAGLPEAALSRASEVLARLEKGKSYKSPALQDLPLFQPLQTTQKQLAPSPTLKTLRNMRPDELSPREALDALYQLKSLLDEEPS
jgi:DNA mismatch repair protein MutS